MIGPSHNAWFSLLQNYFRLYFKIFVNGGVKFSGCFVAVRIEQMSKWDKGELESVWVRRNFRHLFILSNSDTFPCCLFPILSFSKSDTFQIWHLKNEFWQLKMNYDKYKKKSDTFRCWPFQNLTLKKNYDT